MQIMHNFNINFIFIWKFSIDVLDLDMLFNCNVEFLEPFKMKFYEGFNFEHMMEWIGTLNKYVILIVNILHI